MFGDRALGNLPGDLEKDGVVAVTNSHDEKPNSKM